MLFISVVFCGVVWIVVAGHSYKGFPWVRRDLCVCSLPSAVSSIPSCFANTRELSGAGLSTGQQDKVPSLCWDTDFSVSVPDIGGLAKHLLPLQPQSVLVQDGSGGLAFSYVIYPSHSLGKIPGVGRAGAVRVGGCVLC